MAHETEDEQLEALKRWWSEYGRSLLLGVTLGGLIAGGGWWWFDQQERHAEAASAGYYNLMRDLEQGEHARVIEQGQVLIGQASTTVYAGLAALAVARAAVETGETEIAKAQLQWAAENARKAEVRPLARLHLARLLLDADQYEEALAQLDGDTAPAAMRPVFDEVRGDVYLAMGERAQARAAYGAALEASEEGASSALRMKFDDVADAAAPEAARS